MKAWHRVIASFGFELRIADAYGAIQSALVPQSLGRVVVGDWVHAENATASSGCAKVLAVRKRVNHIQRYGAYRKKKHHAANIDVLAIVCAPEPTVGQYVLDAMIIEALRQDIEVLLIANKSDLPAFRAWYEEVCDYYAPVCAPPLVLSALSEEGIGALRAAITGKFTLLLGASGVGKSTLLNAFVGHSVALTQGLTSNTQQGRHTTSNTQCYPLAPQTWVADSPGVRDFLLVEHTYWERAYPDITPYLGQCHFRNCLHQEEQGCAIQKALATQAMRSDRWKSYCFFKAQFEQDRHYSHQKSRQKDHFLHKKRGLKQQR